MCIRDRQKPHSQNEQGPKAENRAGVRLSGRPGSCLLYTSRAGGAPRPDRHGNPRRRDGLRGDVSERVFLRLHPLLFLQCGRGHSAGRGRHQAPALFSGGRLPDQHRAGRGLRGLPGPGRAGRGAGHRAQPVGQRRADLSGADPHQPHLSHGPDPHPLLRIGPESGAGGGHSRGAAVQHVLHLQRDRAKPVSYTHLQRQLRLDHHAGRVRPAADQALQQLHAHQAHHLGPVVHLSLIHICF